MPDVPNKLQVACMLPAAKSAANMMYGGMTVSLTGISPGSAITTTADSLSCRCPAVYENIGNDHDLRTCLAYGDFSGRGVEADF
jgi:hypothetical protein